VRIAMRQTRSDTIGAPGVRIPPQRALEERTAAASVLIQVTLQNRVPRPRNGGHGHYAAGKPAKNI
jgi:hypothetical protein